MVEFALMILMDTNAIVLVDTLEEIASYTLGLAVVNLVIMGVCVKNLVQITLVYVQVPLLGRNAKLRLYHLL